MKFIIEKNLFQTSLGKIQGIAERKSTIPILANILITAVHDSINIVATDLEIGIMEITTADILEKGTICIPARKLYDMVRELSVDKIEIKEEEKFWVSVKAGKTIFNLPGLNPNDFPPFPDTDALSSFSIVISDLMEMIERTVFAASSEESRFNLNGIYMEKVYKEEKDFFRMVATDGHRLSLIDKDVKQPFDKGIILSRRGLSEVRRAIGDEGSTVNLSLKGNNCIFKTDRTSVVVRLLEGEYPDYRQVIPTTNDKCIVLDRKEFIGCLRRAHVVASEKGEGVKFTIKKGLMEIRTGGSDVGNVQEELKIDYEGDPLNVSFNAKYLLDVMNILDTDTVEMKLKDESSSALIRPIDGEGYLYVVMPMRI